MLFLYLTFHLHVSLILGAISLIFVHCLTQIKFMALTGLLLVGQINISEQEQSTANSVSTDDKTATIQYKPVTSLSSNDNTLACYKTASTSLLQSYL